MTVRRIEMSSLACRKGIWLGGFSVLTASSGAMAFGLFEDHPPCLILLDLSMPAMDGITFSRSTVHFASC